MNDDEKRKFLSKLIPISQPDDTIDKIVCIRVVDAEVVAPRSRIMSCPECGKPIWMQADTERMAPKAKIVCVQCLTAKTVS